MESSILNISGKEHEENQLAIPNKDSENVSSEDNYVHVVIIQESSISAVDNLDHAESDFTCETLSAEVPKISEREKDENQPAISETNNENSNETCNDEYVEVVIILEESPVSAAESSDHNNITESRQDKSADVQNTKTRKRLDR